MFNLERPMHIAPKIVMIDGLNGSGKSILGPVIGSLKNAEKTRFEHIYEYLCILHHFNKLEADAGIVMMNIYGDLAIYNSMISREVNFRPFDDTGILNNPNKLVYISRLLSNGGDLVVDEIRKNSQILQLMTHQVFPFIDLAFMAYGERLRVIEMVRHPLYLIDHWFSYIDRYGTDKREFSIYIKDDERYIPWFAYEWIEEYKSLSTMDRIVHSIDWLTSRTLEKFENLDASRKNQVMFVPFEKFVLDPWPSMYELEKFLGTSMSSDTKATLKKQKCPRKMLTQGRGHKHYGWKAPDKGAVEKDEWDRRMKLVKDNASKKYMDILDRLIYEYEERYGIKII